MASAQPLDFASLMAPVAGLLLGTANERLSRGSRLRFGTKGSMQVDIAEGWFDDHEAGVKGGVLDLIRHKEGVDKAGALRWLEDNGLKERDALPTRARGPLAAAVYADHQPEPMPGNAVFYDYPDENGVVLYRVERRGKDAVPPFLQHGPDGRGGFHSKPGCMQGVPRVLYRLPELLAASPSEIVFVCEGEKDADRLAAADIVATTNPGGAGKFTAHYAAALVGRRVIALQDNDEAGAKHVAAVLAAIEGKASAAAALLLPGLPAKGDVSDWLANGGSAFELKRLAEQRLAAATETYPIADLTAWATSVPEPKRFTMAGFIPEHEVTLFTGAGGTNKSTLGLQLCACSAADSPLLGVPLQSGPALYVTAEDEDRENHWRLAKIAAAIGTSLDRLAGKLHVVTLRGRLNNELATFDADGRLKPAGAFKLLRATLESTGAKLLVLDNVGHLYVGNENDRGQVTAFINLLYQLCRELGVTILLIAHPKKQFLQGNKDGNATSGSTAWLNAVRSQLQIERAEGLDPDARVLSLGKANYARPDQTLTFRWHDFALILDSDLPADRRTELQAVVRANGENEAFLRCLAKATEERRATSPNRTASNFAPRVFATMTTGRSVSEKGFAAAMERLLHLGTIRNGERVYQRDNRAWVTGLGLAQTLAPTPAPTLHGPCTDLHTGTEQGSHGPARTHPPYTTYIEGAAHGAAAPLSETWNDNPALGRQREPATPQPDDTDWPDQAEEHGND